MHVDEWFLTADERGNPETRLDSRHADGSAWSAGNDVTVLIHGGSYFAELLRSVRLMRAGDLLLFTDWRGDPDQRLDETGNGVARVFADAAARGVVVKGLLWRSHLDQFAFSEQENRHLGEEIEAAGGECLRDMRVRPGGSHHQKFVVLRHPGRPDLDVVFVGGIDLCHSRLDGPEHRGDHQRQPMAKIYGPRPPWHDVQLRIQGPAVADIETVFRERWEDPARLTNNPIHVISDLVRREDTSPGELPPQLPDPAARGRHHVQVLRTYPRRRRQYPFAPRGERSVAHAYQKVIARAHSLIYLEDQYLWAADVVRCFADALCADRQLRLIAVVPLFPIRMAGFPCHLTWSAGSRLSTSCVRPAVLEWRSMASRTTRAHPCTCMRKCVLSTMYGSQLDRTTSIDDPGPTIPNCRARFSMKIATRGIPTLSIATAMERVSSRDAFGCSLPRNTSIACPATISTSSIRLLPSPPSLTAPATFRRGTTVHSQPGHRAGCVPTTLRG